MNQRVVFVFAVFALLVAGSRGSLSDALCVVLGLVAGAAVAPKLVTWRMTSRWLPFAIVAGLFPVAYWITGQGNSRIVGAFLAVCAVGIGVGARLAFRLSTKQSLRASDGFVLLGLVGALFGGMVLHGYILPLALVPLSIAAILTYQDQIRRWFK